MPESGRCTRARVSRRVRDAARDIVLSAVLQARWFTVLTYNAYFLSEINQPIIVITMTKQLIMRIKQPIIIIS